MCYPCHVHHNDNPALTLRAEWRSLRRAIGRALAEARVGQRLTLARLERISGIPVWRLDQYELGKNEIPLFDLLRLCRALRLDLDALLTQKTR